MSSKMKSHLVATALVAAFLAFGCLFGYLVLGGSNTAPSDASVPTPAKTSACLICGGGSSGSAGNVPPPFPAAGTGSAGNVAR